MKNVSMWYQKKPIPQLSIFCLIQGINNYVQINTYWRYIVQIIASNILLLAIKHGERRITKITGPIETIIGGK